MFVTSAYAQRGTRRRRRRRRRSHSRHRSPARGGHGDFPPFDPAHYPSQLLWLAITFGLFYLFLKRVAVPRIGGDPGGAQRAHRAGSRPGGALKAEADAAVAAYEQELAEARAKANAIGQARDDAAKAEAETTRKQVEAELDGKLAEAEARIASIKSAAHGRGRHDRRGHRRRRSSSGWSAARSTRPTVAAAVKAVQRVGAAMDATPSGR